MLVLQGIEEVGAGRTTITALWETGASLLPASRRVKCPFHSQCGLRQNLITTNFLQQNDPL